MPVRAYGGSLLSKRPTQILVHYPPVPAYIQQECELSLQRFIQYLLYLASMSTLAKGLTNLIVVVLVISVA